MDHQLEVNNALLEAINGSVSLFNDLFMAIAPIDCTCFTAPVEKSFPRGSVSGANAAFIAAPQLPQVLRESDPAAESLDPSSSSHVLLHAKSFTGSQCLQIQHLSGHLTNIRNSVRRLHILHNRKKRGRRSDSSVESDDVFLQTKLTESNNINALMSMQMSAIKNYLMNEINRSEDADRLLHEKEKDLVEMTVQRDDFRKKSNEQHSKLIARPDRLDQIWSGSISDCDVNGARKNLVGSYIRKEFDKEFYFGLVVLFEAPFYKVRTHSLLFTLIHTLSFTLPSFHSHSLSVTHSHSLSLRFTLIRSHALPFTHSHSLSFTPFLPFSLPFTSSLPHTLIH